MDQGNYAFVTLATNDEYSKGAVVLAHSLKEVETKAKLAVLVTEGVSSVVRDRLNKVFDVVQDVSKLDSNDAENLGTLGRPELGVSFTKIHCWNLTQFSKCVFLDADTLVLKNCDELFERPELSAVSDVGWPDCFNSGVFVFQPSEDTFQNILKLSEEEGSFDGGDQGLLNAYFSDWATKDISAHLSFIYNMNVNASYSYLPAYNKFGKNVKIVHFLGTQKPWTYHCDQITGDVDIPVGQSPLFDFLMKWWTLFHEHADWDDYLLRLTQSFTDVSLAQMKKASGSTPANTPTEEDAEGQDEKRLQNWEKGNIDYLDKDSFKHIQKKLDESIRGPDKKDDEPEQK